MPCSPSRSIHLHRLFAVLWFFVIVGTVSGVVFWAFSSVRYHWNWRGFRDHFGIFCSGWWLTVEISAATMVLSVLGGLGLMAGGRARLLPLRVACRSYITLMRGTPLLVVLLLGYYGVLAPLRMDSAVPAGIGLLAAFEAAYLAEIFRGALDSIGRSQREAARAVGFNSWQSYRYVLVPQSIRRALPGMAGELVSLVKSTSLLSVLAIEEVTQITRLINSRSYTALEGFIPLAAAYLVITLPLSWLASYLERRFAYET